MGVEPPPPFPANTGLQFPAYWSLAWAGPQAKFEFRTNSNSNQPNSATNAVPQATSLARCTFNVNENVAPTDNRFQRQADSHRDSIVDNQERKHSWQDSTSQFTTARRAAVISSNRNSGNAGEIGVRVQDRMDGGARVAPPTAGVRGINPEKFSDCVCKILQSSALLAGKCFAMPSMRHQLLILVRS